MSHRRSDISFPATSVVTNYATVNGTSSEQPGRRVLIKRWSFGISWRTVFRTTPLVTRLAYGAICRYGPLRCWHQRIVPRKSVAESVSDMAGGRLEQMTSATRAPTTKLATSRNFLLLASHKNCSYFVEAKPLTTLRCSESGHWPGHPWRLIRHET